MTRIPTRSESQQQWYISNSIDRALSLSISAHRELRTRVRLNAHNHLELFKQANSNPSNSLEYLGLCPPHLSSSFRFFHTVTPTALLNDQQFYDSLFNAVFLSTCVSTQQFSFYIRASIDHRQFSVYRARARSSTYNADTADTVAQQAVFS